MEITNEVLIETIEEILNLPDETDWVEFKVNKFDYEIL
jgi:hypothetical protein